MDFMCEKSSENKNNNKKQCKRKGKKKKNTTEPSSTGRQAPTIDSERVAFGAKQGLEGASTGIAQHKGEAGGGQRTGQDGRKGRRMGWDRTGQAARLGNSAGRQRWALLPHSLPGAGPLPL